MIDQFDIRNSAFGICPFPPFNPAERGTNFAWVQHFIHHLAPHGMAGFVLVRFWFWLKFRAAGAIKFSDKATPDSFREDGRAISETDVVTWFSRVFCQLVARFESN